MAEQKKRALALVLGMVLAGLNLIALNYLIAGWSTARLDLTQEGLFSISPATKRILTSLDESLTIYGYFSNRTHPKLAPLVPEIADLLGEYRAVSKGQVQVEVVDPGENEEIEQEAAERYGVRSTPFRLATKHESAIVNAYFALVVKYGDQYVRYGFEDLIQIEATPDGEVDVRLRNLEYDLTRAIKKVVYGFRSSGELFERVDGDVKLTAIWTPDVLPEVLAEVPEMVRAAAQELTESGGDRFSFEEMDPGGDDAMRQQLFDRYGARPMSLGFFSEGEFYLYALLSIGDQVEQIPLTSETLTAASVREAVEDALRRNTPGFLKTVGVVAPVPIEIPHELRMQMQMPPPEPPEFEEIKRQLREDYQVSEVSLDGTGGVPSEVDILLVLKPTNLTEQAVFHLDQYLMRGGRIVLCAGNYDVNFDQNGLNLAPMSSGLDDWLAHHGVTIDPTLVLDDRNQPLPIPQVRNTPFGALRVWVEEPYPYLVQVREDGFMNPEITATLDSVGIYWGSPLLLDEETPERLDVIPILQSSPLSWTDDDLMRAGFVEYQVPEEGTETHLLAAALTGRFNSFFAGRRGSGQPPESQADSLEEGEAAEPSWEESAVVIENSPETRLVVVGNAEFLSDFVARALARTDGGFFDWNLRFVQNVIDWVSLDNDMLGIRARGMAARQIDRVSNPQKNVIETVNYLIPVAILLGLGFLLHWLRRQTQPLISSGGPAVSRKQVMDKGV